MADKSANTSRLGAEWPQSLLRTKLYIPPARPNLVARPRLSQLLNQTYSHKLVLISAPAGFGKTTAISYWIPQSPHCVVWLSLDAGDNDPARFWSYVNAALQTLDPALGEQAASLLESLQPVRLESVVTTLVNSVVTTLVNEIDGFPDSFALVLDDYHVIESQAINDSLCFLVEHLPPRMHLIVSTRADPPLPLGRLRARSAIIELRAADLRFTREEAASFLNQVMGLGLDADDVAGLEGRTEGWIAGLQLAALSMHGREDVKGFVAAFAGDDRYILDYLVQEVLQRQPPHIQSFMLQTSILDRLTSSLCDAVVGGDDGQAVLEMLERANLFILPLDNRREWYRYHHLFADLLRHRLELSYPTPLPALHRRAAEWFERHELLDEAIGHRLAAGDFEQTARLIEASARDLLFARGEPHTLLRSVGMLPPAVLHSHPRLILAQAWALFLANQWQTVDQRLDVAESIAVASGPEERAALLGEVATCRATLAAVRGDAERLYEQMHLALERLPADDSLMRSIATWHLGQVRRHAGNAVEAEQAFAETVRLGKAAGNRFIALMGMSSRANRIMEQGRLREALEAHRQIQELVTQGGRRSPPVTAFAYRYAFIATGEVLCERNDLETAADYLSKAIELERPGLFPEDMVDGYVALGRVRQAQGDAIRALEAIQEAITVGQTLRTPRLIDTLKAWQARLWLLQGNVAAAIDWARHSGLATEGPISYGDEDQYVALVRVLIAQGRLDSGSDCPARAMRLLAQLLCSAESGGRNSRVIEVLTAQALALAIGKSSSEALAALERALAIAEPEGFVRIFADEVAPMAELLSRVRGAQQPYAEHLLAVIRGQDRSSNGERGSTQPSSARPSERLLVEPLSERELEVLRLVAANRSNQEIAQVLVISINTVKTHLSRLYGKLNARNRLEAIERATNLGLLNTSRR